jgi:hypothetical protein
MYSFGIDQKFSNLLISDLRERSNSRSLCCLRDVEVVFEYVVANRQFTALLHKSQQIAGKQITEQLS